MNALAAYASGFSSDERRSLYTWLLNHNLISSNCTSLADVADADGVAVVERLKSLNEFHFRNVLKFKP